MKGRVKTAEWEAPRNLLRLIPPEVGLTDEERQESIDATCRLARALAQVPANTRELIALVIALGSPGRWNSEVEVEVHYLLDHSKFDESRLLRERSSLEGHEFGYIDGGDSDDPPTVYVSGTSKYAGWGFFADLHQVFAGKAGGDSIIDAVINDLDFTALDGDPAQWTSPVAAASVALTADDERNIAAFATTHALNQQRIESTQDLSNLVGELLLQFKHFVEQQGGWEILRDSNGKPKYEKAAQLLFHAMAKAYLRQWNVEMDREVDLGRGPVDFKLSSGSKVRLLIEFKKTSNGKFWDGLEHQLPSYMSSDGCSEGWFVALGDRSTPSTEQKFTDLATRVATLAKANGLALHYESVRTWKPVSASKITAKP